MRGSLALQKVGFPGINSGKQIRTGLGKLYKSSGFVFPKPAAPDRELEAGTVFGGTAAFFEKEGPVDLLNVDSAVLNGVSGIGDLKQTCVRPFLDRQMVGRWRTSQVGLPRPRRKGGDIRGSLNSFLICLHFRRLMIDCEVTGAREHWRAIAHFDKAEINQCRQVVWVDGG